MRSLGLAVVALFAMSAQQSTAYGLTELWWETEHDWTVHIGAYRFGLEQTLWMGESRSTEVHWGGGYTRTEWLASTIVIVGAGALAATVAIGGLILAALARRSPKVS